MPSNALAATSAIDTLPVFDNEQSWYGPDLVGRSDWIHEFTPTEVAVVLIASA